MKARFLACCCLALLLMTISNARAQVDPRGPIAHIGMATVALPGRVEAPNYQFSPATVPRLPRAASWIWLDGARYPGGPPVAAFFRKEIDLAQKPRHAQIWFSADTHARIYVNGRLAARGPDDGGQDYPGQQTGKWFVNTNDLTPYFRQGKNVICAEVFTAKAMSGRYNTTKSGGFMFEASFTMPTGAPLTISADESWRAIPGACWNFATWKSNLVEKEANALRFDGAAEPQGWRESGFDDSAWANCAIIPSKWPDLVPSEIPPRLEATYPVEKIVRPTENVIVDGQKMVFTGPGACGVRYDRVLSGFIGLKVRGTAGSVLAIAPGETDAFGWHRAASVVLREGEQTLELPFYDSFSVINLEALQVTGPLEITDVRANFVAQPVAYRGAFECSDEKLNRIWESSRWLTEICQQTHHLDSPHHQEPISDPGDYLIIALNNYYAFAQPHLARQDLRKYAWLLRATKYKPFHTSYALLWLQMLVQYEDYTGDKSLAIELSPQVHALLAQFETYRGANGILSQAPDYMFMDWVEIGGFRTHHPPAVIGQGYLTAFYYRALADGARLAKEQGDARLAAHYEQLRAKVLVAYNRELWDEKAGLYRDGKPFVNTMKIGKWLPADTDIETHSAQNNALAVLYDLAPPVRRAPVMRRLMSADLNAQPYFMHFIFGALAHAGVFNDFGTAQMRRWKIEDDTRSFREMWDRGDYSHAWQCTPLFQLSGRVLGVTPLTPGFEQISIAPHPCDLKWAKGRVPTPRGDVEVQWQREGNQFALQIQAPKSSGLLLEIPLFGANSQVTVDGKTVKANAAQKSVSVAVKGGAHRVSVTFGAR